MEIEFTPRDPCPCGRALAGITGSCDECIRQGAEAFWMYMDGKITFPGFMRRLRSRKPRGTA